MKQPGLCCFVLGFKGFDIAVVCQGQADFVQTVEQAVFAVFGNVECECFASRSGQGLLGKVDGELIAFVGFNFFEKLVNLFFGQNDG